MTSSPAQVALSKSSPMQLARVGHWLGSLNLALGRNGDKTVVKSKQQTGPYTVQRALYPEASPNQGICHLIVLHPPGGLVEGDTLALNVECRENSHALITTPSAGKVYQCEHSDAGQAQQFFLHAGAKLEWFPQEMILYNQSLSALKTEIDLTDDAQFCGWEILCLGREIAQDYFAQGRVMQTIELRRNSKPLLIERLSIDNADGSEQNNIRSQNWGLANQSVTGTFIMTGVSKQQLDLARACIDDAHAELHIGLTLLGDVLVCRGLSQQSRHLKNAFTEIWSALRCDVLGVEPHEPRIWRT